MNYKDILAMASAYKQVAEKKTLDPVDAKELKGKHKDRKDKDIDNDGDVDKSDEYLHKRRKAVSASIKGQKKGTEVETEVQEMTKAQKRALQGIKAQPKDKVSLKKAPWDKKETNESVELDEAMKITHVVIDTADDNKVVSMASDEKGAKSSIVTAELPPMSIKDKKTLRIVKLQKPVGQKSSDKMIGRPLKEETLDEGAKEKALKALMTKALGGKRAKSGTTSAIATNGDFVVKDGGSRIIGRIKAGEFQDPLKEEVEEFVESIAKHMSPWDAKEFLKKHKAHNADFHTLPSSAASAMHDKAKEVKYKKSKSAPGSTGRMFHAALQKHADKLKEAKDHGNMNNGSPRGEGLSPSAKKELDRETAMNKATDAEAVNNLNFKTFKAMAKKAPKRSADNDAGDKTMPKNDGK